MNEISLKKSTKKLKKVKILKYMSGRIGARRRLDRGRARRVVGATALLVLLLPHFFSYFFHLCISVFAASFFSSFFVFFKIISILATFILFYLIYFTCGIAFISRV
jgi:hypothetical protein